MNIKSLLPSVMWPARHRRRSLRSRIDRALKVNGAIVAGFILLLLTVVLLGQLGINRLVDARLGPAERVSQLSANYAATYSVMAKFTDGVMDASSAASNLDGLITQSADLWRKIENDPAIATQDARQNLLNARIAADSSRTELRQLLSRGDLDGLEIFRTQGFNRYMSAVDSSASSLLEVIGQNAAAERAYLRLLFFASYFLAFTMLALAVLRWRRIARSIDDEFVEPMTAIAELAGEGGDVDLEKYRPYLLRRDEIGSTARAVLRGRREAERAMLAENQRLAAAAALDSERADRRSQDEARNRRTSSIVARQEADIVANVQEVAAAAGQMRVFAQQIRERAAANRTRLTTSAGYVEQTASALKQVSERSGALIASFGEIEDLVGSAAQDASDLAGIASGGARDAHNLVEDCRAIDNMVAAISDIARRTNMLAINASIEANREEAAGGGFEVISREIKNLAGQSREVAESARSRLKGIAGGADASKNFAQDVDGRMTTVRARAESIVAIIEDQARSNELVAGQIANARNGYATVKDTMEALFQSAITAEQQASDLAQVAEQLAMLSEAARASVNRLRELTDDPRQPQILPGQRISS